MKHILKFITIAFALVIISLMIYAGYIIIQSRNDTPDIVKKKLNSKDMDMPLSDLSKWQINALLKVEDPNFYKHKGIDLKTPGAGSSTISQGVVKLLYFDAYKPGVAKFKQSLIARFAFNTLVSKNNQLLLYVNCVYMGRVEGNDIYGFADASQAYYKKDFKKLDDDEYLSLVAMVISPNTFSVYYHKKWNEERVKRIKLLLDGKYKPRSLMDLYYGPLDEEIQKTLPVGSYKPELYK